MSLLQSRNPAMSVLESDGSVSMADTRVMTLGGTITATSILLSIVAVVGIFSWQAVSSSYASGGMPAWAYPAWIGSMIAGFVVSIIIWRAPKTAPIVAPIHAVLEGVFVGVASFVIPLQFLPPDPNGNANAMIMLPAQAAFATFAVLGIMLLGYGTGILRVGPLVTKIIITALGALVAYTLLLFLLNMFGVGIWNGYADTGMMGIGFTVLCVGLASLFLLLDFQYIEHGIESRAPKYMEWVGAWGLMVTLVWLYIELLRLLAKLRADD